MKLPKEIDDDNFDEYDPSDSDEDYTENEKRLLRNIQKQEEDSDSEEEEVYNLKSDDEEDSDNSLEEDKNISASDIEDDDDIPDDRAWGKKKRAFYSTDYVDSDYQGFQAKDIDLAEQEGEEATTLQQRDIKHLDEANILLEIPSKKNLDKTKKTLKKGVKLNDDEKSGILKFESFGLIEDFKENMILARDYLKPVISMYKSGDIPDCEAINFVITQHELILSYCTNIQMYFLLLASQEDIQHHPVRERLIQYKQLLKQMEPVFQETLKSQIETMLESAKVEPEKKEKNIKKKKLLNIVMDTPSTKVKESATKKQNDFEEEKTAKRIKLDLEEEKVNDNIVNDASTSESEEEIMNDEDKSEERNDMENNEISKRPITYQIAKNKGLTPYRKKELRNPRVKHRRKYRKALIRRKGAVRAPRTELKRYSGEISGIKTSVVKSIPIK